MDAAQKKAALGIMACVVAGCLICPWLLSSREPAPAPPRIQSSLSFNAANAYQRAREFVTLFPTRVLGSFESRQSSGFLRDYLVGLGYSVEFSHFDGRIYRRTQAGRNVLAGKQGQTDEVLVVIAHYDTARTTVQGAMESGAAVGILLELARVFSTASPHRSLLFIFSDGEEWGMLGAQDLARSYSGRNRIAAVLSLDRAAIGHPAGFYLEETGELKGFSPPWLRLLARQAAESQQLPVREPSLLREHFERALLIPWGDQGPFLAAGIPAVSLGMESADRARERAIYHSSHDTIDNIKESGIERFGMAAERIIRMLEAIPSIPKESSDAFRVGDALFMWPKAVSLLHIALFLPLPVIFYFHLIGQLKQGKGTLVARELLACAAIFIPFAGLYFGIRLVRAMRLLPLYDLYPATPKDPALANPEWGVLAGIFGAALFVAVVCYAIVRYSLLSWPKPEFFPSKTALLGLLTIIVVPALVYNSYWATTFLLLPAWIWAWVRVHPPWSKRIRNCFLIMAGGIPCCIAVWIFAARLQIGLNYLWYHVLALGTGLFSAQGYFLGIAAGSIGLRFLVIQIRKYESE